MWGQLGTSRVQPEGGWGGALHSLVETLNTQQGYQETGEVAAGMQFTHVTPVLPPPHHQGWMQQTEF